MLVGLQAVAIFLAAPLAAMHLLPVFVMGTLNTAIALVVLTLTSADRRAQAVILAAIVIDGVSWLLRHIEPSALTLGIDLSTRIVFVSVLSIVLLREVFRDDREGTYHRIKGESQSI